MAASRDQPWSNDEKNFLLAEIIKAQSPNPSVLLNIVNSLGASPPNWNDLALPHGRSVNSCRQVFDELRRQPSQSAPNIPYVAPSAGPSPIVKRPLAEGPPYNVGREIRPKPNPTTSYGQAPVVEPPVKRKRGRPPKAVTDASRAQAEAARTAGQATARSSTTPAAQTSPALVDPPGIMTPVVEKPTIQSGRSMQISSMLTPDAQSKPESSSSSSSGKRRRVRSIKMGRESESTGTADSRAGTRLPADVDAQVFRRPVYAYQADDPASPSIPSRTSPRVPQPAAPKSTPLPYPRSTQPP